MVISLGWISEFGTTLLILIVCLFYYICIAVEDKHNVSYNVFA